MPDAQNSIKKYKIARQFKNPVIWNNLISTCVMVFAKGVKYGS
jgi:hypothetical protein